jgi:triosephosphate isomerase
MEGRLPTPLVVGNWKMYGRRETLREAEALGHGLLAEPAAVQVVVCPPATLIHDMARALRGGPVAVGAQTCHSEQEGPYTGEISPDMLADVGARYVILGHSERRRGFGETSGLVADKARAAVGAGLAPVICVGETLAERDAGAAVDVVRRQLLASIGEDLPPSRFAAAYEPVWCIGTGLTPEAADIRAAHAAIRAVLVERFADAGRAVPILYGGSVDAANAGRISGLDEVSGLLVGRASLRCADFLPLVRAAAGMPAATRLTGHRATRPRASA